MADEIYNPWYKIGKTLSNGTRWLLKTEGFGLHHIPQTGPFIIASNHVSYLDPLIAGIFVSTDVYFLARSSLLRFPILQSGLLAYVVSHLNLIPIQRDAGDPQAFKTMIKTLRAGHRIVLFPEGTRSKDGQIQSAKSGVGMLACMTSVPVLPVRIYGAHEAWGRSFKLANFLSGKITTVFGPPLSAKDYDPGKSDPDRYMHASQKILEAIKSLECPRDVSI